MDKQEQLITELLELERALERAQARLRGLAVTHGAQTTAAQFWVKAARDQLNHQLAALGLRRPPARPEEAAVAAAAGDPDLSGAR